MFESKFLPTTQWKIGQHLWFDLSFSSNGRWRREQTQTGEKREQQGGCWEGKKGATSCGWHPDRLVGVRNGFPEAPERSRHRHYGNATAWQTACSVSVLTNACCQAGTCHSQTQTQTYTVSLTGPWNQHIFCTNKTTAKQAPHGVVQKVKLTKMTLLEPITLKWSDWIKAPLQCTYIYVILKSLVGNISQKLKPGADPSHLKKRSFCASPYQH